MISQKNMYGIIAILIAIILISSTISVYYYAEYSQEKSTNSSFASELNAASSKYNQTVSTYNILVGKYGVSLSSFNQIVSLYNQSVGTFNTLSSSFFSLSSEYNKTLNLLVGAISVLNTSDPAYLNASKSLTQLWSKYNNLTGSYERVVKGFQSLFESFQKDITQYEIQNNVTLGGNFLLPVKPISPSLLSANLVVLFGNSTYRWTNGTSIQSGWNAYTFTLVATGGNINSIWYPQYGEHLITGIDGESQTSTESWFFWEFNGSSWQLPQNGADLVTVLNGSSIAWTLCTTNSSYLPNCTPP